MQFQGNKLVTAITGCSSGVGKALAIALGKRGSVNVTNNEGNKVAVDIVVYATMRSPSSAKGVELQKTLDEINKNSNRKVIHLAPLDVTSASSVSDFAKLVLENEKQIDILINNAGYAVNGTHEMNTIEEAKAQFETNFFGVCRMHEAFVPTMRQQKSGHLIAVSSVGGISGVCFNDIYCASKFALEGYYESQTALNRQIGIQTSLVEPGPIKTDFVANAKTADADSEKVPEELRPLYKQYRDAMGGSFNSPIAQTGEQVAEEIIKVIEEGLEGKAKLRYQTSDAMKGFAALLHTDPSGEARVQSTTTRFFTPK